MAKADDLKARIGLSGPTLQQIDRALPSVPDHELVRRIGQGSYGEVWLARNAVGTWRAVKVVYRNNFKDARPYDREFSGIQKYEPISRTNEGLVDVLQIGRNDAEGYFYYVMELADDAGDESESTPNTPNGTFSRTHLPTFSPASYTPHTLSLDLHRHTRLSFEECITLGMTLNLALGHLHRHGLVHRDVKPSNIIFVNSVPKLADIGLVTDLAGAQSFVGTEGFIPPEGPGTAQADLYALGKVLYEASMGKDRQEFPEPFTRLGLDAESKALMELNAVLLKACAANPKQRYQSAEEMNADLALLHSGRSVKDKHALERRLKVTQRVAIGIAAVMLLGVVPYYLAIKEARHARTEARKSHEVAFFLASMLDGVGASAAKGRDTAMLREILDKTAQRVGKDLHNEPEVEADLRIILGKTYAELGLTTNALAMTQEALRLRRLHLGHENIGVADALANLGVLYYDAGDLASAEKADREALSMRIKFLGNLHTNVAMSLNNLGVALWNQSKLVEAEEVERRALEIRRKLLPSDHPDIGMSLINLANVHWSRGDFTGVEADYAAALKLFTKQLGREHPTIATLQNNLATLYSRKGELAAAEELHQDTLSLRRKLFKGDHPHVAISLTQLGIVMAVRGKLEQAEAMLNEALAMQERLRLGKNSEVADALAGMGIVLMKKGEWAAAQARHEQALTMRIEVLQGENNADVVDSLDALGLLAIAREDLDEAQQHLVRAVSAAKKSQGNDYPAIVPPLYHLGWVSGQKGDVAGGKALSHEALAISLKHGAYGAWPLLHSISDLADILQKQNKYAEAERLLRGAADYLQDKSVVGRTLQRDTYQHLVLFYESWNRTATDRDKSIQAAQWKNKLQELPQQVNGK